MVQSWLLRSFVAPTLLSFSNVKIRRVSHKMGPLAEDRIALMKRWKPQDSPRLFRLKDRRGVRAAEGTSRHASGG